MTLSVVGAGWPRTGTRSLSIALERLLGRRCYHMDEVFAHLEHVPVWRTALHGEAPEPICSALGLALPPEPFPHLNTTAEWQAVAETAA